MDPVEIRLQVGGLVTTAELDDPDRLPRAVEAGGEVIQLGDLGDLEGGRGRRVRGRQVDPPEGEVGFGKRPVVEAEDAFHHVGQVGRHVDRAGPAPVGVVRVLVTLEVTPNALLKSSTVPERITVLLAGLTSTTVRWFALANASTLAMSSGLAP